jgi:hypothetical protein
MGERGISLENVKSVVYYATVTRRLGRGKHKGIRTKYKKTVEGKTLRF